MKIAPTAYYVIQNGLWDVTRYVLGYGNSLIRVHLLQAKGVMKMTYLIFTGITLKVFHYHVSLSGYNRTTGRSRQCGVQNYAIE